MFRTEFQGAFECEQEANYQVLKLTSLTLDFFYLRLVLACKTYLVKVTSQSGYSSFSSEMVLLVNVAQEGRCMSGSEWLVPLM